MKCFAIRDVKAEGFTTPFFQPTFGLAERMFKEACQDEKTSLSKNPEDFSLFYIADFDQSSGQLTPVEPKWICNALDTTRPKQNSMPLHQSN